MKNIFKISLVAILFVALLSCNKDLLDKSPFDQVSSGNMWTTESNADFGVNGVYSCLLSTYCGNNVTAEQFAATTSFSSALPLWTGTATTSDATFSDAWSQLYEGVSRANDAIDNLPNVPMDQAKINRLIAECKFLRAYYYTLLNCYFRGVPLYLTTTNLQDFIKPRDSETDVWDAVIADLTDCIAEKDLPIKYSAGDANFGRATKGAAYSLRGIAYLWKKDWANAEKDFLDVTKCGYSLFQGELKALFKAANEQSDEMIFTVQCTNEDVAHANEIGWKFGSRDTWGSGFSNFLPANKFVDSYTYKDGRPFDWDEVLPGYSSMGANARSVFFLRDNMTDSEKATMSSYGADLSLYLDEGNEARILKAYTDRDPRLGEFIITPYSTYHGCNKNTGIHYIHTRRWPYRLDTDEPYDLRTNQNNYFYYMFRKFVPEGNEIVARDRCDFDVPILRYANILLKLAEALNEQGKTDEAVKYVNMVRERAGVAPLNSNQYTQVKDQADMRKRIQQEVRWELCGEAVTYFDDLRWNCRKEEKFYEGSGLIAIWGTPTYNNVYVDYYDIWPIPQAEIEKNRNLTQNPGWIN